MELQVLLYTMGTMIVFYLLVRNAYKRGAQDAIRWVHEQTQQMETEREKTND